MIMLNRRHVAVLLIVATFLALCVAFAISCYFHRSVDIGGDSENATTKLPVIDYENLHLYLYVGMSADEVVKILGNPSYIDQIGKSDITLAVHNYRIDVTENDLMNSMKKSPDGGYRALTGCSVWYKNGNIIKYETSYSYFSH